MEPTRLFMDAHSVPEWRNKGFHGVTDNTAGCGQNNSILLTLLEHKKNNSIKDGDAFKPEEDIWTCANSESELGEYLSKHPNRGMPYGFPPLKPDEFAKNSRLACTRCCRTRRGGKGDSYADPPGGSGKNRGNGKASLICPMPNTR